MRKIWISDVTMSRADFGLSFREKIELAKLLDRLEVSVIEAEPIVSAKIDSLRVKSIASAVKNAVVAVPVNLLDEESIETVWRALEGAKQPRLQVCAPVSPVQMEYFSHKKPAAMLETIAAMVKKCREKCAEVEFVAEDAGRGEPEFLGKAISAAVEAGATVVTVCDTAGTMLPDEMEHSVSEIRSKIGESVRLGVMCSNELYMADACAAAAVRAGADEVKAAACGGKTTSLESIARIISNRGASFDAFCAVKTTELQRTVEQIKWMCQTSRSKTSPFDSGVRPDDENVVLTVHDEQGAVAAAVKKLGYELSDEDIARVYEAFCIIAGKKERVGAKELDAIVASAAMQVPPVYRVEGYVINSGNIITASAHLKLKKGEQVLEGICLGDGPVDAALLAAEQIIGRHYELDDFQIQAVTEGREAMGEAVVRLRSGGKLYSGRGISTDIIGSSIQAYVSAVNKIVYEEGEA